MVNATTAGIGAPVASTAEDFSSVVLSFMAILVPILVLVGIALLIFAGVMVIRRRRRTTAGWRVSATGRLFG